MSVIIRTYQSVDFSAITALEEAGIHGAYRSAVFVRQAAELFPKTFFVAESNGEPLGYTIGAHVQQQPSQAWIIRMAVREDQRDKGIGSALLATMINTLYDMNVRKILLTVSPGNIPALKLYKRQGFVQDTFILAYFGKGEDRIILKKVLDKEHPAPLLLSFISVPAQNP